MNTETVEYVAGYMGRASMNIEAMRKDWDIESIKKEEDVVNAIKVALQYHWNIRITYSNREIARLQRALHRYVVDLIDNYRSWGAVDMMRDKGVTVTKAYHLGVAAEYLKAKFLASYGGEQK